MMELKPCPFCGSRDVHVRIVKDDDDMEISSQIECYGCLSIFYYAEACCHEEQIEAWNRRAE